MNARIFALAAVAGVLTVAACGDSDNPPVVEAPAQQRSVDDVTSKLPAEWPATQAMRNAEAYPAHGSPWYPTPAPQTSEDPCLDRPHHIPRPC